MNERKKQSSVARKLIRIIVVLGLITSLMCLLNLLAYNTLGGYNNSLEDAVHGLEKVSSKDN